MTDAVSKPGWREVGQIDLDDPREKEYWRKVLHCTHDELIKAVKKDSISTEAVRKHLRRE